MDYIELNLLEMLDIYGEDKLQSILSRFICPQNIDVENFIQSKAIGFARQRLAMTYLVFLMKNLLISLAILHWQISLFLLMGMH